MCTLNAKNAYIKLVYYNYMKMIIIKDTIGQDSMRAIAGEMINMELSMKYFENGIARKFNTAIEFRRSKGYPNISKKNIMYNFTATSGIIFLPLYMNISKFIEDIKNVLKVMENEVVDFNGEKIIVGHKYQSVGINLFTTEKQRDEMIQYRSVTDKESNNTMFSWVIKPINEFVFGFWSEKITTAIDNYITSIFYDIDDICTLQSGEFIHDYSIELLKFHAKFKNTNIRIICDQYDPLLIEYNPFWTDTINSDQCTELWFEELKIPVFKCDYEKLKFYPVKNNLGENTIGELCIRCKQKLVDDNYAIFDNYCQKVYSICIFCLHMKQLGSDDNKQLKFVLRVKYPYTREEYINNISDPVHRDMLIAARDGVIFGEYKYVLLDKEITIKYQKIGDEYISVYDHNELLYSRIINSPEFSNYTFCNIYTMREKKL